MCRPRFPGGVSLALCMLAFTLEIMQPRAFGQQLAYQPDKGQKFSYNIEIVVNTNNETITHKGMPNHTVDSDGET
ncbi:MAG: hypothetical protein VYA84_12990 [Planctomycetota bacterium]|nr:hypothetical protein [Planctomycetota bacterium]